MADGQQAGVARSRRPLAPFRVVTGRSRGAACRDDAMSLTPSMKPSASFQPMPRCGRAGPTSAVAGGAEATKTSRTMRTNWPIHRLTSFWTGFILGVPSRLCLSDRRCAVLRVQRRAFRPHFLRRWIAPSQGLNIALSQIRTKTNKSGSRANNILEDDLLALPNQRRRRMGPPQVIFSSAAVRTPKPSPSTTRGRNAGRRVPSVAALPARFGPAKPWVPSPGLCPSDRQATRSHTRRPERDAYATRAKPHHVDTSSGHRGGDRNAVFRRIHPRELLSQTSGPDGDGYSYCVACGRIETAVDPEIILSQPHTRPYPNDEDGLCPGRVSGHVVMGTDFITDIACSPSRSTIHSASSQATTRPHQPCAPFAKAVRKSCRPVLQIESGNSWRNTPGLTDAGRGREGSRIFVYDTWRAVPALTPVRATAQPLFEEP